MLSTFFIFLKLGLTSFGGPVAHIGYFRQEFVEKRQWLSDASYAELVALCQFLPGPASSQVGIALGYFRQGLVGSLLAWAGFTLPSALALMAAAISLQRFSAVIPASVLVALKAVALVVVVQALIAMSRTLCQGRLKTAIATAAAALSWSQPDVMGQLLTIGLAGVLGYSFLKPTTEPKSHSPLRVPSRQLGLMAWAGLVLCLFGLPFLERALAGTHNDFLATEINLFFRTGSFVFGGGHVVLPLLQSAVVGQGYISNEVFLSGYGLAQAVPGPLFSFAAFLGASMNEFPTGWEGGMICLGAVFAPSFFLVMGALPFWEKLRSYPAAQTTLAGINAGVVGLLGSAWLSQTHSALSAHEGVLPWLIGVAFLMFRLKWPAWMVVSGVMMVATILDGLQIRSFVS